MRIRMWLGLLGVLLGGHALAQTSAVLAAASGPSDNGGAVGSGVLFDLEARTGVVITGLSTASLAPANSTYALQVFTRSGSALGGPVEVGAGSSSTGWELKGTVTVTQGTGEISLPVELPYLHIAAGQTLGVALVYPGVAPRYAGTGAPAIRTFSDTNLILRSGDARSMPFTGNGTFFSSRTLIGDIRYRVQDPVLAANPGPTNNSGATDSGMFFNLTANGGAIVEGITLSTNAELNIPFQVDVYTRSGSALGGAALSSAGWTLLGTASGIQGAGSLSQPLRLPPIVVPNFDLVGVGLVFRGAGPRYFGSGAPPIESYQDGYLSVITGEAVTTPFTANSQVFSSRALVGSLISRPLHLKLQANPGPTDNSQASGAAMFMDITAPSGTTVRGFRVASTAPPGTTYQVQVFTRTGTALGGTLSTGPGSSSTGWTPQPSVTVRQGATGEVSIPVLIQGITVNSGQTRGVALVFNGAGPAYRGLGVGTPVAYEGSGLRVVTGEVRTAPFTTGGSLFVSRELVGDVYFDRPEPLFRNGFE